MSTVAQLTTSVADELRGFNRDRFTTLTDNPTAGVATCIVDVAQGPVALGDYIQVDEEVMLVTANAAGTLNIVRGQLGSVGAAHTAGALVTINPRFPRPRIASMLLREIRSWPREMYSVRTQLFTMPMDVSSVDFPYPGNTVIRILESRAQVTDGTLKWKHVPLDLIIGLTAEAGYAKGAALQIRDDYQYTSGTDIHVTWAALFDTSSWSSTTDLQIMVGLLERAEDLAIYGAAWRLMVGREAERTDTSQGQTNFGEQNPPGAILNLAKTYKQLRDQRLDEEIAYLRASWGTRF